VDVLTLRVFVRRPVVLLVLLFVAGTYAGLTVDVPRHFLLAGSMAFCLCAFLCTFPGSRAQHPALFQLLATVFIAFSTFLAGWLSAEVSPFNSRGGWSSGLSWMAGEKVEITGVVSGDADVLPASRSKGVVARFSLRVKEIVPAGCFLPAGRGEIQVLLYGPGEFDVPSYGECWRISGKISRPGSALNGMPARPPSFTANSYNAHFVEGGHGWWLADRCYAARRASAAYLSAGIEEHKQTVDILHSLLLGYRRLSYEMRQVFVFTGTLHIFAISGSHVVVFAGIIIVILGMLRISSVYWGFILAPLLCAYTFATGLQSSAARACIMAIIYWSAPLLGRRPDGITALAVSALIIVGAVPTQLFDRGFILSFVCVLGLIVLYPMINGPVQRRLEPDPLRLQPETRVMTLLRAAGRGLWSLTAMSISAWLVSAPLTAYFFGNFTPAGLLANLIVVPVSALVILTGCLSLVLGACVHWLAVIFNHANIALIWLMVRPMELMAQIPYANIKIDNVPVWSLFVWYSLLAGWVFRRKCRLMNFQKYGDSFP